MYAFPVVVAPPEMVSPPVAVPSPIVEEAKTPIPTVVDGARRDPLYDQFVAILSDEVETVSAPFESTSPVPVRSVM